MHRTPAEELRSDTTIDAEALRRELERLQALASRDRGLLTALLRHSPHGIVVCDRRGRLVLQNRAAERIWGGSATTTGLADWSRYRAFHPDGRPYADGDWSMRRAVLYGEVVEAEEVEIERFDGSRAVILGSTAPVRSQDGEIHGAIAIFADITRFKEVERALLERERGTADRLARLHAFTAALSEAQDVAEAGRVTVEHGQAALRAAGGRLWMLSAGGEVELVHGFGSDLPVWEESHRGAQADALPAASALRGEAVWIRSREEFEHRWPELSRALAARLGPEFAYACLPLETRAGRIGALGFSYVGRREFNSDERALLLAVSRQAAQAVDRARLLEAERRAHAESEATRQRMAFLLDASVLLTTSLELEQTLPALARLAVPRIADCCAVNLADSMERGPIAAAHVDPGKVDLVRALGELYPPRLDAASGIGKVMRSGAPELHADVTDDLLVAAAEDAEHLRRLRELGLCSAMVVPMTVRGRTLGVLTFATSESRRRYGPGDLDMAQSLGRRAALAVDNARLYAEAQQAIRARDDVLAIVSHDLRNPLHAIGMASSMLASPSERPDRVRAHARAIERSARRMGRLIRDLLDSSRIESGTFLLDRRAALARSLIGEAVALVEPLGAEKQVAVAIAPGAEALEVHCDPERIVQVLVNLLANAVAFTPAGGRVVASAGAYSGEIRFSVADTGPGIAPEDHQRIFDRYWKSRDSRQGTGLGLAIAKGLVEAHGGRIWVESTVGAGATFHFTIPRRALPTP